LILSAPMSGSRISCAALVFLDEQANLLGKTVRLSQLSEASRGLS
jgi:hypothetical protein